MTEDDYQKAREHLALALHNLDTACEALALAKRFGEADEREELREAVKNTYRMAEARLVSIHLRDLFVTAYALPRTNAGLALVEREIGFRIGSRVGRNASAVKTALELYKSRKLTLKKFKALIQGLV